MIDYDAIIEQITAIKVEICKESSSTGNFKIFCHLDDAARRIDDAKYRINLAKMEAKMCSCKEITNEKD